MGESAATAGLLGHPIAHSLSPAMHNAAYRHLGLNWRYSLYPCEDKDGFQKTAEDALRGDSSFVGFNVTMPWKAEAFAMAGVFHGRAALAAGAANVLTPVVGTSGERQLEAANFDGAGIVAALAADGGIAASGSRFVVCGTGAVAAVCTAELLWRGAASVTVLSRSLEKAEGFALELAARMAAATPCGAGFQPADASTQANQGSTTLPTPGRALSPKAPPEHGCSTASAWPPYRNALGRALSPKAPPEHGCSTAAMKPPCFGQLEQVASAPTAAPAGWPLFALAYGHPDAADAVASADAVIDATPAGMTPGQAPLLPVQALHAGQVVLDAVYGHGETPLLREARLRKAKGLDGLGMLVEQAALTIEHWCDVQGIPCELPRPLLAAAAAGRL